jgi:uroporphyrinogen-III decarboxylase
MVVLGTLHPSLYLGKACQLVGKQTQKTEKFDECDLRAIEQRLERVCARLLALRNSMVEADIDALWLFNSPSMRIGCQNFERFSIASEAALDAALRGQPYGPDTTKSALDEHG